MKNGLFVALLLMLSSTLLAQTEENNAFNSKGKSFIKLSFSDVRGSLGGNRLVDYLNLTTEFSYGKFVKDRFAIGASVKYGVDAGNVLRTNNFIRNISNEVSLSAFARYYMMKKNGLFVEAEYEKSLLFNTWDATGFKGTDFSSNVGLSLGYTFVMGKRKRWSIEPKYTHQFSTPNINFGVRHHSTFSIGVTHHFGGKKKEKIPSY